MSWLKRFWITFISFLPFAAGAMSPLAIGGIVFGGGIIGYSIFRSISPVNISDALTFFSTCWSCQLFSDIIGRLSSILPTLYDALGKVIIPLAVALTAIWFTWDLIQVYVNPKFNDKRVVDGKAGMLDAWSISGKFGTHCVKVLFIVALMGLPLPRMVSTYMIEPIFDLGLSMNYTMSVTDARQNYANCIVATAIADRQSIAIDAQKSSLNAFAPRFRHNLTCQIANVHQMTGLGMTVGWTMLNMAFNYDYMHKIMWSIPIFPNIPMLIMGAILLMIYFMALLPIPLFFLEIFVKLSIDFIFLPLTLLSWLFKDWKLFSFETLNKSNNLQKTIDDVISGTVGLALTGIFITFSIMVLDVAFGGWQGASALQAAIAQNDSKMLMDGLVGTAGNQAFITLVLLGIFITMFMVMIPALIKSLFNVTISDKYYQTAKKDVKILWNDTKKVWQSLKK